MSRRQRGEWLPRTWFPSVRSATSRHTPNRPGNPRHCHVAPTFTPPSTGRMRSTPQPNPPAHPVGAHLFRLGSAPQLGCGDQQNTCYTHTKLRNDSRAPH